MIAAGLWELPPSYFSEPLLLLASLTALGFCVGMLTGIFGVGGGFLVTPLMVALLGLPASTAVGSGLCFIIGTSSAGLRRQMRLGNYEPVTMLILGSIGVFGTILGAHIHESIKAMVGVGHFDMVIQLLYLPMLLTTAWLVYRNRRDEAEGKSLLQRCPLGPRVNLKAANLPGVSVPGLVLVGLCVGIVTGLLGVGGGVLFMPILLLVVGLSVHQAIGTSLGVVMFNASVGAVAHGWKGNVSLVVALALLVTSTVGVQIGVWICNRLHATRLRKYFAAIVLLAAVVVASELVAKLTR